MLFDLDRIYLFLDDLRQPRALSSKIARKTAVLGRWWET